MEPERGDPNTRVSAEDVAAGLRSVGVTPGDTVLFHSSLSSMGQVEGGAATVIEGFLLALGPEGTVAVPTLVQRKDERSFETWDIEQSPSNVGRITETLRLWPGALRSDHPTHAVAALGARAAELTRDHTRAHGRPCPWGDGAFAPGSPWDKLRQWNGGLLFIGVDFHVNTTMHLIQSLVVERALAPLPEARRAELLAEIRGWRKPGLWSDYPDWDMEPARREAGLLRYGKIGSATVRHTRSGDMIEHALRLLEAEPERWLNEAFLDWYRRAQEG
jgi:aminoglycoside 3-N-acetyltransferase